MDGYWPVIVIEGFLGLGVVLLLYFLHLREMKKIKADKARRAAQDAAAQQPDPGGRLASVAQLPDNQSAQKH